MRPAPSLTPVRTLALALTMSLAPAAAWAQPPANQKPAPAPQQKKKEEKKDKEGATAGLELGGVTGNLKEPNGAVPETLQLGYYNMGGNPADGSMSKYGNMHIDVRYAPGSQTFGLHGSGAGGWQLLGAKGPNKTAFHLGVEPLNLWIDVNSEVVDDGKSRARGVIVHEAKKETRRQLEQQNIPSDQIEQQIEQTVNNMVMEETQRLGDKVQTKDQYAYLLPQVAAGVEFSNDQCRLILEATGGAAIGGFLRQDGYGYTFAPTVGAGVIANCPELMAQAQWTLIAPSKMENAQHLGQVEGMVKVTKRLGVGVRLQGAVNNGVKKPTTADTGEPTDPRGRTLAGEVDGTVRLAW